MFLLGNNKLSGTIPTEIYTMGSHVGPDEEACALEDLVNADGTPLVIPEGGLNWTVEEYAAFNGTCATHAVHRGTVSSVSSVQTESQPAGWSQTYF